MEANSKRLTPTKKKKIKRSYKTRTLRAFSLKSHDILYHDRVYLYLGFYFCHKWTRCGDFYLHPHSSTTMSSNFWRTILSFPSKRRTDIGPSLVGTQHASSSSTLIPFFFSSKAMRVERLGNFFRCDEEHLPLQKCALNPPGAMILSERPRLWKLTYMPTFRQVSTSCWPFPRVKLTFVHGASPVFGSREFGMVLYSSKTSVSSLCSTFSFSVIAHGVTSKSWEVKSDTNRYSIVMIFTTSFSDSDDWVDLSNITAKMLLRQSWLSLYGKGLF